VSDTTTENLNRRYILKKSLAFAAGVAAFGPRRLLGDSQDDGVRWAFLSDTHIASTPDRPCQGFYPHLNLQEIVARIESDLPDGLVITGDLAMRNGRIEAYDNLKTLLAPISRKRPVCLGIGNHDDRDDFFQAFTGAAMREHPVQNRHIIMVDAGPVRLLILDSLYLVNMMPGLLGQSQRAWLKTLLHTSDEKATILCLHHTPKVDLLDTGRFFDIIGPMTKVKAVVYGHSHKYEFSQYEGIHLINLPATAFNFSRRQPVGWVEAHLTAKGGRFTLHAIGGNRQHSGSTEKLSWRV
jgi:3',5'-cyclic AMP phosphodiesterase CpdA